MTEKKFDKKVKEVQETLKEQELDQVTGGGAFEPPARPTAPEEPKKNIWKIN